MREVVIINKYEKSLMFKPAFIRFLWIVIVALNWVLPLRQDYVWNFSLFRVIITIIWTYGMLTATGVLCVNTHVRENGMILYEQNTSAVITSLGIMRILQVVYYALLRRTTVSWTIFIVLTVLDVVYLLIIILDKSSYGYAVEEKEKIYKF